MKRIICFVTAIVLMLSASTVFSKAEIKNRAEVISYAPASTADLDLPVKGACLIEASSGTVLYADDEHYSASPASVTKVMSLLLVAEALEAGCFALTDNVTVSAYAASMGGSQVFLEEGESMTVEELIKCMVIASANDATVAMAELVAGSESEFVRRMNARAEELGLENTSFENTTGLDDDTVSHYSSPYDIALMSRELIKHSVILKYSSLWQDSIRGGEFILTNTNRLVRYYEGCNGLKTGSTDKAGFCLSATAKRDGMQLIAVVMGADTRDARNNAARTLLDYGFANYAVYSDPGRFIENAEITSGVKDTVPLASLGYTAVVSRADKGRVELKYTIPESIAAPISEGDAVGKIEYYLNGERIGEASIVAGADVARIGYFELLLRLLGRIATGR